MNSFANMNMGNEKEEEMGGCRRMTYVCATCFFLLVVCEGVPFVFRLWNGGFRAVVMLLRLQNDDHPDPVFSGHGLDIIQHGTGLHVFALRRFRQGICRGQSSCWRCWGGLMMTTKGQLQVPAMLVRLKTGSTPPLHLGPTLVAMNTVREIDRINQKQLELGDQGSWHDDYKDSAYIFVGGIPYELTEGDIICVFSQYGEILDLNMPRDRETGKPKGFAFLKYDDQRSTVLAVDNFNGTQLLGRTLRVDHSRDYRQTTKRRKRTEGDREESSSEEELDDEGKPRVKGFNVAPKGWLDPPVEESEPEQEENLGEGIDIDDPMRDYLIEKRREEKIRQQAPKKIKVEGEDKKHTHRHRSRKVGEEDGHRHRHHHRHRHRVDDGKRGGEEEDADRKRRHRRKDETPERSRQEDTTPQRSRRDDRTPEPGVRDDTTPKIHRRDVTPLRRDNPRDTTPPRQDH